MVDLGAASAPEDVAVVSPRRVYVTRRDATHLLRVDPTTGETEEVVDLGVLADADRIPDLGTMAIHRGRLFVQVRRTNFDAPELATLPATIAVIDLRDDTPGRRRSRPPGRPGASTSRARRPSSRCRSRRRRSASS